MIYGDYLRNKYHHAAVKIADAEGVPCIMEYSKGKNLRNYEIYGNSVQNSTPSPDNPVEIQSVGDLTKNLLPYPYYNTTKTLYGVTWTDNGDGTITVSGTPTGNTSFFLANRISISPNTKYCFSGIDGTSNIMLNVTLYDENNTFVVSFDNSTTSNRLTFDTTDYPSAIYARFLIKRKKNGVEVSGTIRPKLELGSTATEYEPYHKYDVPITVRGKNLLPNSDWMSGAHSTGFTEQTNVDYITEYTQNSVSFNLSAWTGVSSPRFQKDSVKRIVFKINQNQINSDDGYIKFYIIIQGYDDNNNKVGSQAIYDSVVADTGYVFDFSTISIYSFYKNSKQFSFCILARKNALSNLMVYDIAYYADTDTTEYEPYVKPTITHIYLDEPLRKVGDYADYIDFKNQKVIRNVVKHSLTAFSIYKKLNGVIRIGAYDNSIKQKYEYHILSTIFNYGVYWTGDIECIFHHNYYNYHYYWSVYWSRLGLTYDGTNVYRTDDVLQTPLTDREIISIAKEWLSKLSDKDKEIYMILDTPTEEPISLPVLKTFKGTTIISVDTSIQPSNIKGKYIRT